MARLGASKPSAFAAFIRNRRRELGLSQSEVAARITTRRGHPAVPSAIGRWEAETRPDFLPSHDVLTQLAEALRVPVADLIATVHRDAASREESDALSVLARWQAEVESLLDITPEVAQLVSSNLASARNIELRLRTQQG